MWRREIGVVSGEREREIEGKGRFEGGRREIEVVSGERERERGREGKV